MLIKKRHKSGASEILPTKTFCEQKTYPANEGEQQTEKKENQRSNQSSIA
jgi:hypothetical protein